MSYTVNATGICKSFGGQRVLDQVDLAVETGSVLALLGPNGAGKTTMVRILATLLRPDAGTATVAGHDLLAEPVAVKRSISLTGQYAAVDDMLTGQENLEMMAQLRHLPRRQVRARATQLLADFDLLDARDRRVATYSGGMKRRLDLAISMVERPELLFLDEPSTGLDPRSREQLWGTVRRLVDDGVTVLLTTQYLEEADRLARRVAVIDGDTVIAEGSPDQLKSSVGGEHLEVALAAGADVEAAIVAVKPFAAGSVQPDEDGRRLSVPVAAAEGLTTRVVRALDDAGVHVHDVTIQRASLDDVFLSLTGHLSSEDDSAGSDAA
jgi:ABC-2 type transport system ATP-binding protein